MVEQLWNYFDQTGTHELEGKQDYNFRLEDGWLLVVPKEPSERQFGLSRKQQIMVKRNRGLLWLMAIGNQSTQNVDKAIDGRAMARMLNLRNVLQLVNNRFND
jgi:hypothetical protein